MQESLLDQKLNSSIKAICEQKWEQAQATLSQALEDSQRSNHRRLTLFLLSIVAEATGHIKVSRDLIELAKAAPIDSEARDLLAADAGANPLQSHLQKAWLDFNGIAKDTKTQSSQEIDWAYVLDSVLEGRTRELEIKYAQVLDSEHPHRQILWNFVALSYLESGDLRTHEEMRDNRPSQDKLQEIPSGLKLLLEKAALKQALDDLAQGEWVTLENLTPKLPPEHSSPILGGEEDFINALSARSSLAPSNDQTLEEYYWGETIETAATSDGDRSLDRSQYWEYFQQTIRAMKDGDRNISKSILQNMLAVTTKLEPTLSLLTLVLFAGSSVLESDHQSAQESLEEIKQMLAEVELDPIALAEAADHFSSAGCSVIAQRMDIELLNTLDPWHDFVYDFAPPS